MAVISAERISGEASRTTVDRDTPWRSLYRVGAIAAALYVVMIIVPLVLVFTVPQPPLTGGAAVLEYIASNKAIYLAEYISFVGLSLPAMVVFLALYVALKDLNRTYAALGAVIGIASEAVALAHNSSPPSLHGGLLYLSDQYATAANEAQRASLASGAEGLIAVSNGVTAAGILTALGILFISLPMLRGVFSRGVAYLGIATGVAGIVCETFRDMIGLGYFVYGILLPAWFIAVGWKLYRLGWGSAHSRVANQMQTGAH